MTPRDIALATLPPALWAITYVLAKPATEHFPPMFLVAIVYALTAAMLLRPWRRLRTPFITLLAGGTIGTSIQSALIYSGIALVPASLTILVVQSQVPFAVLAAFALGIETLNWRRLCGITVALGGIAVIVGAPSMANNIGGLLLIVAGAASWGLAQAFIRRGSKDSGSALMGVMAVLAAPQLLVFSCFLESGQRAAVMTAGWLDWVMVVALAGLGYALPYGIWYSLLRRYRVDQVAPFALLMPILGVLASAIFLGEHLSLTTLLGGAIIVAGLGLVIGLPGGAATTSPKRAA